MRRIIAKTFVCPLFLMTGLTFGCGRSSDSNDSSESELKWGMHSSGLAANLLNLRPRQSVAICSQNASHVTAAVDAIKQWSSAIGRWGHFTVNKCGTKSDLVINVRGSSVIGRNQFTARPGFIEVLSTARNEYLHAILLHEVGHSWGMCDQYMSPASARCRYMPNSGQNNSEVMGTTTASKLKLTAGDIKGVQQVAAMNSPVNNEWKAFNPKHSDRILY